MTVTFPLYFASANGFPYCLTVKSYTPFSGVSLAKPGKAERRDVPATAATDNTLWRRLKKALWSSSSSRTLLFSSVVVIERRRRRVRWKTHRAFSSSFSGTTSTRQRWRPRGGKRQKDRRRHPRSLSLSLFYRRLLRRVLRGVSLWEQQQQRFGLEVIVHSRCSGQTTRQEKARFFVKKCIHSRFHSSHAFAAREEAEDISAFCCFFFFDASQWSYCCITFILHISAREALDTPPREAGIPSLARETHRLIVFARGFFGEEDKETEKRKF